MGTVLKQEPKGEYTPAPAGSHTAICYGVVDLGTQAFTWEGETKINPQIALFFEIQDELLPDGKPFTISSIMTMSSHKKSKLRAFLEAWRSVPFTDADFGTFDIAKLIGIGCMLGITQTEREGKVRSKITTVMKLPKGLEAGILTNPKLHFTLDAFDQKIYDSLADYWKETIAKSPEYKQLKGIGQTHDGHDHDEVTGHLNDSPPYDETPF